VLKVSSNGEGKKLNSTFVHLRLVHADDSCKVHLSLTSSVHIYSRKNVVRLGDDH